MTTKSLSAVSEGREERRRHRTVVTRNTEYHFRDDLCVMVRETSSPQWVMSHEARGRRMAAAVRWTSVGARLVRGAPVEPGDCLYFADGSGELLTSRVVRVERPARRIVDQYPAESV
jgi:hypothetical protein